MQDSASIMKIRPLLDTLCVTCIQFYITRQRRSQIKNYSNVLSNNILSLLFHGSPPFLKIRFHCPSCGAAQHDVVCRCIRQGIYGCAGYTVGPTVYV